MVCNKGVGCKREKRSVAKNVADCLSQHAATWVIGKSCGVGAYDFLIAATSLTETAPSFLSFYWTNYILCSNSFSAHHLVLVLQRRELQDDDESICWANNNAYHHSFSCTNSVTLTEAIRLQCLWDEVCVPFHLKDHFFVNMRCVCCSNIKLWNKNKWLWWSTTAVSKF